MVGGYQHQACYFDGPHPERRHAVESLVQDAERAGRREEPVCLVVSRDDGQLVWRS